MKILIDMNLSPDWVRIFADNKVYSIHWSFAGDPKSTDVAIMQYARDNGYVVFTHDLDFGAILAATNASGPSVIQVRTQDVFSEVAVNIILKILEKHRFDIENGALITVDQSRSRVRILPLRK